jgi:hypothetical protein
MSRAILAVLFAALPALAVSQPASPTRDLFARADAFCVKRETDSSARERCQVAQYVAITELLELTMKADGDARQRIIRAGEKCMSETQLEGLVNFAAAVACIRKAQL